MSVWMLQINVSTLFCAVRNHSREKNIFFPEPELPQPIVSLLCHTVEHDHEHCAATEWHPSHGLHICHHSPHPPFNEKARALPKGSSNTRLNEQMLTWSLAHKAFTLICNDKAVRPTNVCSVFSKIPKIPHMKKTEGKKRWINNHLSSISSLAILRLNRRQTGFTPNDWAHEEGRHTQTNALLAA